MSFCKSLKQWQAIVAPEVELKQADDVNDIQQS